jgi:hypothetical protein
MPAQPMVMASAPSSTNAADHAGERVLARR